MKIPCTIPDTPTAFHCRRGMVCIKQRGQYAQDREPEFPDVNALHASLSIAKRDTAYLLLSATTIPSILAKQDHCPIIKPYCACPICSDSFSKTAHTVCLLIVFLIIGKI
jgi:hypothetical protein